MFQKKCNVFALQKGNIWLGIKVGVISKESDIYKI